MADRTDAERGIQDKSEMTMTAYLIRHKSHVAIIRMADNASADVRQWVAETLRKARRYHGVRITRRVEADTADVVERAVVFGVGR